MSERTVLQQSVSKTKRMIVLGIVALTFAMVVVASTQKLRHYIGREALRVAAFIGKQAGIRVDFRTHRIGLGTFAVEEVRVVNDYTSTFGEVAVKLQLNPFAGEFLSLERVSVERARIKASFNTIRDFLTFVSSGSKGKSKPDQNKFGKVRDLLNDSRLPRVITLTEASGDLYDNQNKPVIGFENLELIYDRAATTIKFKVDMVAIKSQNILQQLQGEIKLKPTSEGYPVSLSYTDSSGAKQWTVKGSLAQDLHGVSFFLKNKGMPRELEPLLTKYLKDPELFTYAAKLNVYYDEAKNEVDFGVQVGSGNLKLQHPLLAEQALGPFPVRMKVIGRYQIPSDTLLVDQGSVSVRRHPQAKESEAFNVDWGLRLPDAKKLLSTKDAKLPATNNMATMRIIVKETPCQQPLSAMPKSLLPRLDGFQVGGSFQGTLDVTIPIEHPEDFRHNWVSRRFDCRLMATPEGFRREKLYAANPLFMPELGLEAKKNSVAAEMNYTPYEQLPVHFLKALLVAEDVSFYSHNGFSWGSIEYALRKNLTREQVVAGGSTISMQTAKNLFLSRERTVSRKIQEWFFTWYLEQVATKNKILELYANIIEYGPGIYGIDHASRVFFNKVPSELNPMEAVYLASILPSPGKRIRNFCAGNLSLDMEKLVHRQLEGLLAINAISAQQYQEIQGQPLLFDGSAAADLEACTKFGKANAAEKQF